MELNRLAEKTLAICRSKGLSIVTAESCSGGLIAAALTDIAGSSDVFDRGYITYSNQAKFEMLGVPLEITNGPPGAVSKLVAEKMAEGALNNSAAGISVAVTGIAGPGGATADKPVGLVFIGLSDGNSTSGQRFSFNGSRDIVRRRTVNAALDLLRYRLL